MLRRGGDGRAGELGRVAHFPNGATIGLNALLDRGGAKAGPLAWKMVKAPPISTPILVAMGQKFLILIPKSRMRLEPLASARRRAKAISCSSPSFSGERAGHHLRLRVGLAQCAPPLRRGAPHAIWLGAPPGARSRRLRPAEMDSSDSTKAASWLARAKFLPPAPLAPLVDRGALLRQQTEQLPRLILLQAPAGYGKSTLLAQWRAELEGDGQAASWLTLDDRERDPSQFLTYFAHALQHAGVDIAASGLLSAPGVYGEDVEFTLRRLVGAVLADGREVISILDDFERIDGSPACAVLERLLAIMPPNMHLAIASRRRPSLRVSRLRAQGHLREIGARELRFTAAEAVALLESAISRSGIRTLMSKTEGWPVALQLARHMILSQGVEEEAALAAASAAGGDIGDFIAEHTLAGFSAEEHEFLRDAAPFEHVDAVFADFVCERSDSARMLEELGDLNPLIARLGDGAYRLHPLVADYLRAGLETHDSERLRRLYTRAADWHGARGSIVEALRYAALAERGDLARRIVEDAGGIRMVLREGMARVRLAFRHVSADVMAAAPRVALVNTVLLLTEGQFHRARREFDRVRAQTYGFQSDRPDGDDNALRTDARIVELYFIVHGDVVASEEYLAALDSFSSEHGRDEPGIRSFVSLFTSLLHQQRGAFDKADVALREFEIIGRLNGSFYSQVFIHLYDGMIAFGRGRLALADMHYKRAQRVIHARYGGDEGLSGMMANTLLAEVEFERNQLDSARSHIAAARRSIEHAEGWFDIFAAGHGVAAKLAFLAEGLDGAMRELDLLENVANQRGLDRVRTLVNAWRVRMLLRVEDGEEAEQIACTAELREVWLSDAGQPLSSWRERDAVAGVMVRLAMQQGRHQEALAIGERMADDARAGGRAGALAKAQILRTRVLQEQGEARLAMESVIPALEYAASEGAVRLFLDEDEPMAMLIELCVRDHGAAMSEAAREFASELLSAFHGERSTAIGVRLFSRRQRQILLVLGRGQSNKEIARLLDLSEDAVKYHLKKIFRTLGVERRRQAIAEARRQSLIP